MRWEQQLVTDAGSARLPGYRDATVRHFDAPEAIDTRFYEVQAKSILNRVPEASQVPFRWTINPYRGCTHACAYCLSGDARILMADGSERTLAALEVGDRILGTAGEGSTRRLTETRVVAKWSTHKPAFSVDFDNGRQLVASADHRLLTSRGWRHVADPDRPHLELGDRLVTFEGGTPVHRTVTAIAALGAEMAMFDITTGTSDFVANGVVSHNCFARPTHEFLDMDAGRDFEREIVVKVNAPELLRAELAKPTWKGEHVALGTNTDPYQWVEGRYELMRGIWEALRDARNPCSVLTKSPLLVRDLDLMLELNDVTDFSAALSIPTLEPKAWRATEPRTPNPVARLDALAQLSAAGIRTGVLIAPLMPGINDSPAQVRELVRRATDAGADYISGLALHLRKGVREVFMEWLADARPDLVPMYERLYQGRAYMAPQERRKLTRLLEVPGGPSSQHFRDAMRITDTRPVPAPEPAQERLF